MAEIIRMPEVLTGAVEAAIQSWLLQPGESVSVGQPIAEVETDKAMVELTAELDGVVGRHLVGVGDSIAVGAPILIVLQQGERESAIGEALAAAGLAETNESSPVAESQQESQPTLPVQVLSTGVRTFAPPSSGERADDPAKSRVAPNAPPQVRRFASPLARRIAVEHDVDASELNGTGPGGRIVRRDVERFLAARSALRSPLAFESLPTDSVTAIPSVRQHSDTEYEDIPLDRMRRAIARRLTESKSTVPHFYLVAECRVDELLRLRADVNDAAPHRISVNDFVLKAVAGALVDTPAANAIWNGDSIRRFSSVDVSVAVATDGGLSTPVVRGIEKLRISELASIVTELAGRARAGRLRQNELDGGSFTVSNLGMYGITQFSAILNPPHSGILAVGAARKTPIVSSEGTLEIGTIMTVTLSADHRVLDGAIAAQWLEAFKRRIEHPLSTLV